VKLKDVDQAEVVFRLRAGVYAFIAFAVGFGISLILRVSLLTALLAGAALAAIIYFGTLFIAERTAQIGATIYRPSGSSTPPVREYSLADSLVARGMIEEAAEAYHVLSEDFPDDPEPRIRHARLLRDEVTRYEDAAVIFKSILTMPSLRPETELIVLRELVELHTHKLQQPNRALPFLARIVEGFGNTAMGAWALQESNDIKQQMRNEHERDVSERA